MSLSSTECCLTTLPLQVSCAHFCSTTTTTTRARVTSAAATTSPTARTLHETRAQCERSHQSRRKSPPTLTSTTTRCRYPYIWSTCSTHNVMHLVMTSLLTSWLCFNVAVASARGQFLPQPPSIVASKRGVCGWPRCVKPYQDVSCWRPERCPQDALQPSESGRAGGSGSETEGSSGENTMFIPLQCYNNTKLVPLTVTHPWYLVCGIF